MRRRKISSKKLQKSQSKTAEDLKWTVMILYVTCSTHYFDLMRTQAQQKMSAHVSKQRKSHQFITD